MQSETDEMCLICDAEDESDSPFAGDGENRRSKCEEEGARAEGSPRFKKCCSEERAIQELVCFGLRQQNRPFAPERFHSTTEHP